MASWDTGLPLPDAIEIAPEDINLRTQMEKGPDRVRGRATAGITQIAQQWTLKGTELILFRTMFHTTLNQGRDWVDTAPIFTGTAYENKTVRFVGIYRSRYATYDQWIVNATLELDGDLT